MSTIVSNVHGWVGGGEFGEPPNTQLSKSACDAKTLDFQSKQTNKAKQNISRQRS